MRVLVTRPEPDASMTKAALEAAGLEAVVSPLMTISFEPVEDLGPGHVQAIIVTSRNAVRSLARSPVLQGLINLPVFAVGPRSAQDAHDLGFHGVMEGPGTAAELPELIVSHSDPAGGKLVHFAGYKLAFDLESALKDRGFQVQTERCYQAQSAEQLTPMTEDALRSRHLDAVLLMSPEASRTYVRLISSHGLEAEAADVACVCISKATADALKPYKLKAIRVAERPNLEEVLALVNRMAEQSRS